jgi:hypothetical protein
MFHHARWSTRANSFDYIIRRHQFEPVCRLTASSDYKITNVLLSPYCPGTWRYFADFDKLPVADINVG